MHRGQQHHQEHQSWSRPLCLLIGRHTTVWDAWSWNAMCWIPASALPRAARKMPIGSQPSVSAMPIPGFDTWVSSHAPPEATSHAPPLPRSPYAHPSLTSGTTHPALGLSWLPSSSLSLPLVPHVLGSWGPTTQLRLRAGNPSGV
ncbi:hypothetical protein GGTG_13971 [Gaeumannomyces tritici R3-111a-1]|uniref:Uncharacterized protein n=1 Tax=Gaeumannomyces tritici (strain R3-111a-1) TaxID=644352 RepID=J3PKC0_GAET3|nr:hypothetical protein GGTG_13971 [Gaeumannomyces tritici R3-111a-1]EJT68453.1 hypothetical protein GGTG_13971 [Gaeumannomyces tritici R3-111a-1]